MTWIINVHLVMFEVRELFPGEIQFVFGSLYCGVGKEPASEKLVRGSKKRAKPTGAGRSVH